MKNFFLGLNMGTSFVTAFIAAKYLYEFCGGYATVLFAIVMSTLWFRTAVCILYGED